MSVPLYNGVRDMIVGSCIALSLSELDTLTLAHNKVLEK